MSSQSRIPYSRRRYLRGNAVRHSWRQRSDDQLRDGTGIVHVRTAKNGLEARRIGDDTYEIKGYGLEWDVAADIGWFTESFTKGAFKDVLDGVRFKIGHDYGRLALARSPDTMKVREDGTGLYFEAKLDLFNPDARAVASAIERGDVNKSSIGFSMRYKNGYVYTPGDEEEGRKAHYEITRVEELWEISAVDFPAHESSALEPRDEPADEPSDASDADPVEDTELREADDVDSVSRQKRRIHRLRLIAT